LPGSLRIPGQPEALRCLVVDAALTRQFREIAFNAGQLDRSIVPDSADSVPIARPMLHAVVARPAPERPSTACRAKHETGPRRRLSGVRKKVLSTCLIPQQFA